MTLAENAITYVIQILNWIYSAIVFILKGMAEFAGAILEVIGEIIEGLLD